MAGTGGAIMGSTFGPPSRGRWTRGTVEVLDTNVGSEIMPLVTDRFRCPDGVTRPGTADGVVRPFAMGFGDGIAEDGGDMALVICGW